MKKRWLLLLIAILTSLLCSAQPPKEEMVLIPVRVLDGIVEDLTRYDGLKITLSRKDSVITIQGKELVTKDNIIFTQKLTIDEYKQLNKNMEELLIIKETENKDIKRETKIAKRKYVATIVLETILIVALIIL